MTPLRRTLAAGAFLLSLFFLFAVRADLGRAEGVRFGSRLWQVEDGLPHNNVLCVLQTRDGYLWIGTPKGLVRYDGFSFKVFDASNTPQLGKSRVNSICEAKDGTLWIGTASDGVKRLRHGAVSRFEIPEAPSLTNIFDIHESRDGAIWIAAIGGGIRVIDDHVVPFDRNDFLAKTSIREICEDNTGTIWIATPEGIVRRQNDKNIIYTEKDGLPSTLIRAVFCDSQNNLWVGTANGLSFFSNGKFRNFSKKDGLADNNVGTIYQDHQGNLWIGTVSGLSRRVNDRFITEINNEGNPYGQIYAFTEGYEGNLWMGTQDGLYRLTPKLFTSYTTQQGLSHNNVTSVLEDSEGALWCGTWGGGLHRFKDGKLTNFSAPNGTPIANDLVLSLCQSRDGSLWIGTDFVGGLVHFVNGKFENYSEENGYNFGAIRVIHEDRTGKLWIGTSTGLFALENKKLTRYTRKNGLSGLVIRSIFEDHAGTIWIGTDTGACRYKDGHFTTIPASQILNSVGVDSFYEDAENTLWIGSLGAGLFRCAGGKFTNFTTQQGLFSDDIFAITEDAQHNLWITCLKGIFRVSKHELDAIRLGTMKKAGCTSYDKYDGMVTSQCSGSSKPTVWKARDGRFWFATAKGLVVIDPQSVYATRNETPPPVRIQEVLADNKSLADDFSFGPGSELKIEPGHRELKFRFAALSFRASEKNRYKYKLDGIDPDWVDAGANHIASYNNVPPGNYTFRVIACNNDGIWNEQGAQLAVVLLPNIWQTWWFITLYVITGIGAVAFCVRYISTRNLQHQLTLLERKHAIEKERARIAQDMHDDIGARLTEILYLSNVAVNEKRSIEEMKPHVKKIASAARDLVRNLDAIVWAINPKNDALDRFAVYIYEYTENFLAPTGIRCRLDVPDELPNLPVSSEVRHNLFLVVKEALNNTAKHSCAEEVCLRLKFNSGLLDMAIEDNGKGFSTEKTADLGNGLINMEKRMTNIGGCFALKSSRGSGTQIRLQIRIQLV